MRNREMLKESTMLKLAKHLQIPVIPVKYFTYDYLYNLQSDLFHNEHRVHSEFYTATVRLFCGRLHRDHTACLHVAVPVDLFAHAPS